MRCLLLQYSLFVYCLRSAVLLFCDLAETLQPALETLPSRTAISGLMRPNLSVFISHWPVCQCQSPRSQAC